MFVRLHMAGIAFALAAVTALPGINAQAAAPVPPVPFGTVLVSGAYWAGAAMAQRGDLNVYSNGTGQQDVWGAYGPAYECTELAERWAAIRWGVSPGNWNINYAYQMFDVAPGLPIPFAAMPNGGGAAPIAGDLLVFDRSPRSVSGHVAVVVFTGPGYVDIVEQNWGLPTPAGFARLPITGTTMPSRWGLPVRGWLRPGGTQAALRTPAPVQSMYRDLLGRAADPGGLSWLSSALNRGAPPTGMALTLAGSAEGRGQIVQGEYSAVMRRPADPAGRAYWSQYLLTHSVQDLDVSLMSTPEYLRRRVGGTNAGFVTAVYRDALGRPADRGGRATAQQLLRKGVSRTQIAALAVSSQEGLRHRVAVMYVTYLHRPADAAGLAYKTALMQGGRSMQEIAADMVASPEYAARFR